MTNTFFIPVGRRYEATRALLEPRLETGTATYEGTTITWVDSGYVGDDEYLGVMTPDGIRYHSRSKLFPPGAGVVDYIRTDATGIVGNEGGLDIDFRVEVNASTSFSATHGLFLDGENGHFGIGSNHPHPWDNTHLVMELGEGVAWEHYMAGAIDHCNYYYNGYFDGTNDRFAAANWAQKVNNYSGNADYNVSSASGAADGIITWENRLSLQVDEVVINESGVDRNFRVEGLNETYGIFHDAQYELLGLCTGTPLQNIGSAAGDLTLATNRGLHILGDGDNGDYAYLIVEGTGDAGNGFAGTNAAHILLASNIAAHTANARIFEMSSGGRVTVCRALNDDLTVANDNMLVFDHVNGYIGIGKEPSSILDIDLTTEDLEIVDAGSAAATEQDWIEVEVGGNQGYIRVYAAK